MRTGVSLLVAALVLGLAFWPVASAGDGGEFTAATAIVAQPERYLGEHVAIRGHVARPEVAPAVFAVRTQTEPLLVLAGEHARMPRGELRVGTPIEVAGRVERMTPALRRERDFAFDEAAFFGGRAFDEWRGTVGIVATRIDATVILGRPR